MRHDHTDWLIHFVRDRVPDERYPYQYYDDTDDLPEDDSSWPDGELESDADAFTVLRTIIRLGGLLSAYSIRSGRTTIYGGKPVVCATEMPLYSFAKYAQTRGDTRRVSAYGVAFLKKDFFAAGGRPAIYGLSSGTVRYSTNEPFCRVIDPSILPVREQYRYVAFNPQSQPWIDWSHEREWRWVARDTNDDSICCRHDDGALDLAPGLPLFGRLDKRSHFSRIGILVWTDKEARRIQTLLTGLYLAQANDYDTPFDRDTISRSFIVTLESTIRAIESDGKLDGQTVEGLEAAQLIQPVLLSPPPADAPVRVAEALQAAARAGGQAAGEYVSRHALDTGACGYAYAVTHEVTSGLVQYMLDIGAATGPFDGVVHIHVPQSWPNSQSIDYNEAVCESITRVLSEKLGIAVYMQSALD